MATWAPTVLDERASKFISLVDALQRDIEDGRLQPGTKLPPYRDLAISLRISPGTVSKAYVEAERRGLVKGEVGRGTFVRNGPSKATTSAKVNNQRSEAEELTSAIIDLSLNTPPILSHNKVLAAAFASLSRQSDSELQSRYLPYFSHPQHQEAAVAWIARHGLTVRADEVILTNGAQHAMTLSISAVADRGDVVFTDRLTYPGMISLASYLGIALEPVEGDGEGMTPQTSTKLRAAGRAKQST
jgi:DNA-binding transcriptional MocR family regulator